jgi:LPXTG-motif cell wall-anchored protein
MQIGETVTLTYVTDIDGSTLPGLYKDLALAYGCKFDTTCAAGDTNSVVANAEDPGFVSDTYVGTQVNIVKDQQNGGTLNKHTGEVLGASTELPATGANEMWLTLAGLLFVAGLGLVFVGHKKRRIN